MPATGFPVSALPNWLAAAERDRLLEGPSCLEQRAEVLDRLDMLFPEPLGDADTDAGDATVLRARVHALRARLEAVDAQLFAALRDRIRHGDGAAALAPWLHGTDPVGGDTYDHLDSLVEGILRFEPPQAPSVELPPEMVRYQPTPARHIFDLVRRCRLAPCDVLVDLGSGLGHVPLLVSIATSAQAVGIELEPAYVACARQAARALGIGNVRFDLADVRAADFRTGTVFYLYTPFRGSVLRSVLDALREQATRRAFRVCTYGPCTAEVMAESWLQAVDAPETDRVTVFTTVQALD